MISPTPPQASITGEIPIADGHEGQPSGSPRQRNWAWIIIGAPALAFVVLVLLLRWRTLGSPLTIALVGLTPFLAVPLLFGAVSSWFSRSVTMRAAAGLIAAAFLFTTSPIDAVIGCGGRTADDSITIYTANVLFDVGRPADVATSILAADPDVILMQETSLSFMRELQADPRMAEYQYRSEQIRGASLRTVIWSRLPILSLEMEPFDVSDLVNVTVASPYGEFVVTGLHTLAPIRQSYVPSWQRQFDQLAAIDTSTPRLIAGDFNATSDHKPFRTLLQSGWTDVHDEAGCGFDATWPVNGGLPIAVMRLDHVLMTDHFEVLDVQFGEPAGSDHKPVIASIRLR
ncbi:MAG: endonuclease/exonuclease/phosphatase family protein [Acidimicrobiales bacterium]